MCTSTGEQRPNPHLHMPYVLENSARKCSRRQKPLREGVWAVLLLSRTISLLFFAERWMNPLFSVYLLFFADLSRAPAGAHLTLDLTRSLAPHRARHRPLPAQSARPTRDNQQTTMELVCAHRDATQPHTGRRGMHMHVGPRGPAEQLDVAGRQGASLSHS